MHFAVLKGLLITSQLLFATTATGIDGKLDFGGSHAPTSGFRSENKDNRNRFAPFKYSNTIKTSSDDFENIGIVCTSGGCNTTEVTNNNTGNTIQTDVHVHVQTKFDFSNKKTEPVGETPDIPIVVGYEGSQLDATIEDNNSQSFGPQSIFVPNVPDVPTYNSAFGSLTPSVGSRIDTINSFDNLDPSARSDTFYVTGPSLSPPVASRIDTFSSPYPSSRPSSGFYVTKSSPVASRVDYVGRSFEKIDPEAKSGFYPSTDPQLNINIKPLSSVSVTNSDTDRDVKYKENGIEIKIPYFDPSYHSHYYGENPPPQYVWHSKKTAGFNPVEFKTVKSTWTPSVWNRKEVPNRHNTNIGQGVKCSCKEEHSGTGTGLRWYPNSDRRVPSINDPGSQINDKLAPLN